MDSPFQRVGSISNTHVGREFELIAQRFFALQGVDLQVSAGETLAIVGASGSGKSTLLHLMGALDAPTSGSVQLHGQDLAQRSAAEQGRLRN